MTAEQLQHLLVYLGYDTGGVGNGYGPKTTQAVRDFQREFGGLAVDGKAGQLTEAALRKAVGEGWTRPRKTESVPNLGTITGNGPMTAADWAKTKYFRREEPFIGCSCGKCGGFPVEPQKQLMRLAVKVREHFDAPMIPTSTVRCAAHNAASGGAASSRHLKGLAMDFKINGHSASEILAFVKRQPEVNYAYAVNDRVVHMDVN